MITHEEAAIIRASSNIAIEKCRVLGLIDGPPSPAPTTNGRQALAEYDAHYTTIERSELERLQALERKIEAFFAAIDASAWSAFEIEIDEIQLQKVKSDPDVRLSKDDCDAGWHTRLGDAMRKAFELFEVPNE